jgi:hypothetical protein
MRRTSDTNFAANRYGNRYNGASPDENGRDRKDLTPGLMDCSAHGGDSP